MDADPDQNATGIWPLNRNHEAARRRVNEILRDHGRPDHSRRETQIAELLEDLLREREGLRAKVYGSYRDALTFYAHDGNYVPAGIAPTIWKDNGARAREALAS